MDVFRPWEIIRDGRKDVSSIAVYKKLIEMDIGTHTLLLSDPLGGGHCLRWKLITRGI